MADTHKEQPTGTKRPNPIQMQKYLKGVTYPAAKNDLLSKAASNNAPDDVVAVLKAMPGDKYASPAEVMKAVGKKE